MMGNRFTDEFRNHARSLEQIHRDAEKLFVVLEDQWLDIYKRQQEGLNDRPDWFDQIQWEMGKQIVTSFKFDVYHECFTMVLTIEVEDSLRQIFVKIDDGVINLYNSEINDIGE